MELVLFFCFSLLVAQVSDGKGVSFLDGAAGCRAGLLLLGLYKASCLRAEVVYANQGSDFVRTFAENRPEVKR